MDAVKKPKYPLPNENVEDVEDVPTEKPSEYPYPNDRLQKSLKQKWEERHHTAEKVNLKTQRNRNKRCDR